MTGPGTFDNSDYPKWLERIDAHNIGLVDAPRGTGGLVAGWLLGYESHNTRTAYRRDIDGWLTFCRVNGLDPVQARRPHIDAWARALQAGGASSATVARRLAAMSSWYSWLVAEDVLVSSPVARVRRPRVSACSVTLGPDRSEARALLHTAHEMSSKYELLIALLLLNGLRVSEVLNADIEDVSSERSHTLLRVIRKGGRRSIVPLSPRASVALGLYLSDRLEGPIFPGSHSERGRNARLTNAGATFIVKRVARAAGIPRRVTPHALRHAFVTLALEAGVPLTAVQDAAGHADPRTTRRYDSARQRIDDAPTHVLDRFIQTPLVNSSHDERDSRAGNACATEYDNRLHTSMDAGIVA